MTRKDYEKIAQEIRAYREECGHDRYTMNTVDDMVEILSNIFAEENPRFDATKFRVATR